MKKKKTKQETFFKKKWVLFINNLNSSFLAIANMLHKKKNHEGTSFWINCYVHINVKRCIMCH